MRTLRYILEQGPDFTNAKPVDTSNTDVETGTDNTRPSDDFLDRILSGEIGGGGSLFGSNNDKKVTDPRYGWTIKKKSDDPNMMASFSEAIQSAVNDTSENDKIIDSITIEELEDGSERLVLTGQTKKGKHHLFPLEKKGGEWGWVDDVDHDGNPLPESEHKWYKFSQY